MTVVLSVDKEIDHLKLLFYMLDLEEKHGMKDPYRTKKAIEEQICWLEYSGYDSEVKELIDGYKNKYSCV